MAKNNYGIDGSPNSHVAHPSGLPCYGSLPEFVSRGDVIPAGDIYLRVGNHRGPNSGFGVRHIWAEHEKELVRLGYHTVNDVARFVCDVIQPGAGVYCEFNHPGGKHRPKVLRSALGIVILEPKEADWAQSGWIYSVVTAYETHRTQGTLLGRL